jgi:hypothetical protein
VFCFPTVIVDLFAFTFNFVSFTSCIFKLYFWCIHMLRMLYMLAELTIL